MTDYIRLPLELRKDHCCSERVILNRGYAFFFKQLLREDVANVLRQKGAEEVENALQEQSILAPRKKRWVPVREFTCVHAEATTACCTVHFPNAKPQD